MSGWNSRSMDRAWRWSGAYAAPKISSSSVSSSSTSRVGAGTGSIVTLTPCRACSLHSLEDRGDALTDADAHRDKRVAAADAVQLTRGGECDAGARGAQRVADCDRPAVHVDTAVVERQFEAAQAGQHLRGEGLVDLDHVDVGEAEPGAGERLFRSFDRADPHD